jgi:hypothetical protein
MATTERHNQGVAEVWRAFHEGHPTRVPCYFNIGRRFWLLTPWLNERRHTFQQYLEDPAVQWEVQLGLERWLREEPFQDTEVGLPAEWPGLRPDFQNIYEAVWLGCPLEYRTEQVPDSRPLLKERKGDLVSLTIPDPLHGGIQGRGLEFYEYFEERRKREMFAGRPVGKPILCGGGTDGPFTVACNLRGTTELCLDLYEDPRYALELLEFVTEAIIVRVRAVRRFNGAELPQQGWGFADDSTQLLTEKHYRDFVLPFHQRLIAEFSKGGPNSMHLCGHVQRLLPVLNRELNVQDFDLGFPVDLGEARRALGPGVMLRGNLHPEVLREGPAARVRAEVAAILRSGVMEGGQYAFCDGNNVAPGTPVAHFLAAYETVKELGQY